MRFSEWEPVYRAICADLDLDPDADDSSVRVLEAMTRTSDLVGEDCLGSVIGDTVTVIGDSPQLEDDLLRIEPEGCIISSGTAVGRLMRAGYDPDIIVTDLDGPIGPQLDASAKGAVTLILAHGDNRDLVRRCAPLFRGRIVLTTQNRPRGAVLNFGGFTDGDRAVCLARHFGAGRIILLGFDLSSPNRKPGSDPGTKRRKLEWARRIVYDGRHDDLVLPGR